MPIRALWAGWITPKMVSGDIRLGTTSQHQTFTSRDIAGVCCRLYFHPQKTSLSHLQFMRRAKVEGNAKFRSSVNELCCCFGRHSFHKLGKCPTSAQLSPLGTSGLQVKIKPPPNHLVFIRRHWEVEHFSFCLVTSSQGWSPSLLKFRCEFVCEWSCSSTLLLFPCPVFSPSEAAYISLQLPFFLAHRVIFLQLLQFSSLSSQIPIMGPARAASHLKIYLKPPQ